MNGVRYSGYLLGRLTDVTFGGFRFEIHSLMGEFTD
jgi:hypothetical protein